MGTPVGTTPLFTDGQIRHQTIEQLKGQLTTKLGGMIRVVKDIRTDNLLYRGVPWPERPALISDLSYPPPGLVQRFGRLNRPGQPMFYGSRAPPGVFYELRAREGDHIAWSEWQVLEPLWMHNLGYHDAALARMGAVPAESRLALTDPIPNETARNRRLRRQVAMAFIEDVPHGQEHRYKQSAAIAEFWRDHDDDLEMATFVDGARQTRTAGFVYPAVQMRGDADNVVLLPEFVHSSLAIRQAQYVRVERADLARLSFTFLTVAAANQFGGGGEILWRDELAPEVDRRCHIDLEDGVWVQRDGHGRVYGTHQSGMINR